MSEHSNEKKYPIKQSATFATSTFAVMGLADVLAHLGPTGLLVGGLASYVAWKHGPELLEYVREQMRENFPSSDPSDEDAEQAELEDTQPRKQGRGFWEWALGVYPDEEQQAAQDQKTEDKPDQQKRNASQEDMSQAQSGKAVAIPSQFTIGRQMLAAIREINEQRYVYFGTTATQAVTISIDEMYHVLDVASSGKGKSNRFRLAMMQVVEMADTYYINPLANAVKAVKDSRKIEVWTPIFDRLANKRPVKDGAEILHLMSSLVQEIEIRNEQEEQGDFSWTKQPIFVFIDELPEVFARCPQASDLLDKLGRMGRQFCVFAWVASQTAQVKDIGLSTASQAQFKTRIYGGGDKPSADRVMKGALAKEDEKVLQSSGAGLTVMLADGFSDRAFVRAPLVTNEALFAYFGLPPFRMEDWLASARVSRQPVPSREEGGKTNLSPFTLSPDATKQAQNVRETAGERVKGERGKRVKGPNEEAILEAIDAIEREQKVLTLNAIAKKAGLTWHQYDEIEEVAAYYGYDLERGKGRPAKDAER